MNPYIGHPSQLSGAEETRLVGGKGDGMRLLRMWNGRGVELTLSLDRCADLSRVTYRGMNCGYFAPCGYVAPAYYDKEGIGFLKSFTAGFLTTCGFNNVGSPNEDQGEALGLHGSIGNTPCEQAYWTEDENALTVHARIVEASLFGRKLTMHRTVTLYKEENRFEVADDIVNDGNTDTPLELLYHMNMGYPLLTPESELYIPSRKVVPRDDRAAEDLDTWDQVLEPQQEFEEQCYFHAFKEKGLAAIYSPLTGGGLAIRFDPKVLPFFTQWKMMGQREYVMGLEPGNCHPDGRAKMRQDGLLTVLTPGEKRHYGFSVTFLPDKASFDALKNE